MTNHPNRGALPRPKQHLAAVGKRYPNAWRRVDEFRADRGRDGLPDWPEWCFLPLAGSYAIVSEDSGGDYVPPERIPDVARLAALAAWRVTQGIYRIDPDLYAALIDTPVSGDLPCSVLYRLPEWCIYIETPGLDWHGLPLFGFWAHLEWDANDHRPELRLLLDTESALQPFPLHLVHGDLDAAIDAAAREARRQAVAHDLPSLGPVPVELRQALEPLLSLLLYLCSQNAEIGDGSRAPANPQPKRTKKGWRLFPAAKPAVWDVGVRIGSALRRATAQSSAPGDGAHASPRAHIRRAHWHTYWTGPTDGDRTARLKWLPPIPVNLDSPDGLPATIRPVRK
jgi:hypothetical protein